MKTPKIYIIIILTQKREVNFFISTQESARLNSDRIIIPINSDIV